MCRILAVRSLRPVEPRPFLKAFAERCRRSKEYQGDGWGVAWWVDGAWRTWRTVEPIWSKEPPSLPAATLFLAHARSAFRNEGVVVENNMPFVDGSLAFAFNGELRRVRLHAPGATGAWRLFHLLRRFAAGAGDVGAALRRLDRVVTARTEYVRALNIVASDGDRMWVNSHWGEDPDYFTLWRATLRSRAGGGISVVASDPFDLTPRTPPPWRPVPNGVTIELAGSSATPDGAALAATP